MAEIYLQILACLIFSVAIYLLEFFDVRGALATFVLLTVVVILSPFWWFFVLVSGYIMIFVVTVYRHEEKRIIRGSLFESGIKRTYTNVLGKVAIPTVAAIAGDVGMFISAVSFGVADSLANEIGILSKRKPRLVTTMKRVRPGTNGAVSPLGTFAGSFGSLVVGFIALFLGLSGASLLTDLLFIVTMGVLGSFVDSFMGAMLENRGLINGWQVNFLTSLIIGLIGTYVYEFVTL